MAYYQAHRRGRSVQLALRVPPRAEEWLDRAAYLVGVLGIVFVIAWAGR